MLCAVLLAMGLYVVVKPVDSNLALLAFVFELVYVAVGGAFDVIDFVFMRCKWALVPWAPWTQDSCQSLSIYIRLSVGWIERHLHNLWRGVHPVFLFVSQIELHSKTSCGVRSVCIRACADYGFLVPHCSAASPNAATWLGAYLCHRNISWSVAFSERRKPPPQET